MVETIQVCEAALIVGALNFGYAELAERRWPRRRLQTLETRRKLLCRVQPVSAMYPRKQAKTPEFRSSIGEAF